MDTRGTNVESCKVIEIPQVIVVKECSNVSSNQNTNGNLSNDKQIDDRILVNPLNLEDASSISSDHDTVSVPDDGVIDIEQCSSMKERIFGFVNCTSVQLFVAISLCFSSFLSLTLVPYHNVILFPYYWYESILPNIFGSVPCCLGLFIVQIQMILEYHEATSRAFILKLFLTWTIFLILSHCLGHILWTAYLGYVSPIPFSLVIDFNFGFVTSCIVIWHLFPENMRCNSIFRSRLKAYFLYILWVTTVPPQITIMYETIKELCSLMGQNLQWITALLLFALKKSSNLVMSKYMGNVAGSETSALAKGMVTIENDVMFKSFVLVLIGSNADAITGYCFLGVSFLLNMKFCFDIVRVHNQEVVDPNHVEDLRNKKKTLLTTLILKEIVELVTAIAYVVAVPVAYYGPNAKIIGNIQNDYWQYNIIDSLSDYLTGLFYSMGLDLLGGLITLLVLWSFCNINGLLLYKENTIEFAFAITFCITREINLVSNFIHYFD